MKKKWIIISLVLVTLSGGGYGGWKYFGQESDSADQPTDIAPQFPTAAADVGEVKKTIYSTGTIEAKEREEVKPDINGKVENLLVSEGQHVNKGDVLFTMDTSDTALELKKMNLNIMRAQKELAELQKRKPIVRSDKSGKVKVVSVKEGDQVSEDTVIAKIVNTDYLKIGGDFTELEAAQLKIGQKVNIFLPGSLSTLQGTVSNVDLIGSVTDEERSNSSSGEQTSSSSSPHNVEVLVKKPGGLHSGEMGIIKFTDPNNGILYESAKPIAFELPKEIDLVAGTSGKIKKVRINTNDSIRPGQVIADMDTSSSELELREKELSLQESILGMEQKQRDISKKQVTAPISGEITKLDIQAGDAVDTGKTALIIMDTSSFSFNASVEELDIPLIQSGQTADVYVTAFGDKAFQGKVIELPKEGTKTDKKVSFEVKISIQNNGKLSHGMTGDCDINIQKKENVTRLPVNAVEIMEAGKGTVMVKDPTSGDPIPKDVEVGVEGAEFVEILKGIAPGEEVLVMNG